MKSRQDHIDFDRNYCVHYQPQPGMGKSQYCAVGQDIANIQCVPTPSLNDDGKMLKWGPCIGGHTLADPCAHCPKWERRSLEHAEARADSVEALLKRMKIVDPVIYAWRDKKAPFSGKSGVIECPVCNGKLHLSQSSYNGHVRAACETADCVNFIE